MSSEPAFAPVPAEPDHAAIEHRILERWDEEGTFEALRRQNAGKQAFSFFDGPITANNPMGVHHAWGRTLKDLFQRYHAMLGEDLRYQNGFDCQGLWVEVEVEKALGLNSKREIEEYGLDRFARACRERVAEYARAPDASSRIRLGSGWTGTTVYYTMTDTNISYIWHFLKACHERGWLYSGHRPMAWCARCGTVALAARGHGHRLLPGRHPPVALRARSGSSTRAAARRVPAGLDDDALDAAGQRRRGRAPRRDVRPGAQPTPATASSSRSAWRRSSAPRPRWSATLPRLVAGRPALRDGAFDDAPARRPSVAHRVIAWDDVSLEEGTGIVHIAPGCGAEDFELGTAQGLPTLVPVDEAGAFIPELRLSCTGLHTADARRRHRATARARRLALRARSYDAPLPRLLALRHRADLPRGRRVVHPLRRDPRADDRRGAHASSGRPAYYGKRMEDWLHNMGDWCISRKRYWGLPLPFYPCDDAATSTVIGSRGGARASARVAAVDGLEELHRPWIDDVKIDCSTCGADARRVPEVGDCWLDAGIVPFSTLGWHNERCVEAGYATARASA